jgi:hypothetical protein
VCLGWIQMQMQMQMYICMCVCVCVLCEDKLLTCCTTPLGGVAIYKPFPAVSLSTHSLTHQRHKKPITKSPLNTSKQE